MNSSRTAVAALAVLLAACGSAVPAEDPTVSAPGSPATDDGSATALPGFADALSLLDPILPPSLNFDLARWYLTLPSGSTVSVDALNDGYEKSETFYTDEASGGLVFRCPNLAGTTGNSHYSRTELREMRAGTGSAKDDANNWTLDQGGTLTATLRVDQVSTTGDASKVGRVIIGQIHGYDSEPIRLYYDKGPDEDAGRIYAGLDSASNASSFSRDIVPNGNGQGIALGEPFRYRIQLQDRRLTVRITRNDGSSFDFAYAIDANYAGENLYFKAGVYNQNNTGDADDYVQATFFALEVTHS